MSRLGGFDGLEVALLGDVGRCTIGREMRGGGFSCGEVEFFSEEGKQGGLPGLRAIGKAFGRGVGGMESGEGREVTVEPRFKGNPGGEWRELGNGKVIEQWDEDGAVGQ